MEHAPPIKLAKAIDLRNVVADAGGDQELARPHLLAAVQRGHEGAAHAFRGGNGDIAHFDGVVLRQLLASEAQELGWRDPVAGEITVQRGCRLVPRMAVVAQQDAPPAAAEDERGAQTRGPAASNDDVIHEREEVPRRLAGPRSGSRSGSRSARAAVSSG